MAKTRTTFSFPDDDNRKRQQDLVAAAFVLEEKSQQSLLYNAQTIDYITNSVNAGQAHVAWYYWQRIPELRYLTRYIANALSVATLYVGESNNTGAAPKRLPDDHPASNLLEDFAGGYTGQADLLDRLGLHLTVAGDSILIGPKNGSGTLEAPFDQWRVFSSEEVYSRQGKIYLKFPGNAKEVPIPAGALAIRIWRPHPKFWWDADSPVKGSFEVLKELDMLNQHILASGSSRLVGAGLMGIPEELDLPGSDVETEGTEVDQFVALLIEIMGMAKKNPESPAARIPIMVRGPADYIDKIKHFDFSTEFSNQVPALREGSIRRLALGMDVPPEILMGSANSNSWSAWQCLSQDTEILTAEGWRTYDQVKEGDTVLTLNHVNGLTEWQPVLSVFLKEVDTEAGIGKPMVSIEGRGHSSLSTWDHKWPVLNGRKNNREWAISADLGRGDKIITAAPHRAPLEAKWSDAFVELVAWFWTEGWIRKDRKNQSIGITQSGIKNSENVILIRRALIDCFGTAGWSEYTNPKTGKIDWRIGVSSSSAFLEVAPDKIVSLDFIRQLTASQLELFIDRSTRADGVFRGAARTPYLGQKDIKRLDAFELAGILAGYGVGRHSVTHQGFHEHVQHYVSLRDRTVVEPVTNKKNHTQIVHYKGIVWCPTTPNATWCARRNGHVFFTGNTDESTLRVHLIPLLQLICSSLTAGWLRPMLESLPLTPDQEAQIPQLVVHFDTSNLRIHQDVSGDAQALYDRYEISADALRLATGYGPNAVPTNKELARQILLEMIKGNNPQMVPYALASLRDNFGITDLPDPKTLSDELFPRATAQVAPTAEGDVPAGKSALNPTTPAGRNQSGPTGPAATAAPAAAPDSATQPATAPVKGPLPGARSQAKQTSAPPVPKIGDQGNNAKK